MTGSDGVAPSVQGCLEACERCESVLDAVSDDLFVSGKDGHQPIGAHLRHALDHLICFLRGLPEGVVDYDSRDREASLERDPALFREALEESKNALRALSKERLGDSVRIRQSASLGSEPVTVSSTVERELLFLSSHTIHHLAMLVFFCREEGIELPEETSLAFSTSAYLRASAR